MDLWKLDVVRQIFEFSLCWEAMHRQAQHLLLNNQQLRQSRPQALKMKKRSWRYLCSLVKLPAPPKEMPRFGAAISGATEAQLKRIPCRYIQALWCRICMLEGAVLPLAQCTCLEYCGFATASHRSFLFIAILSFKATPGTGLHCKLLRRSYWQVQQLAEDGQTQAPWWNATKHFRGSLQVWK